MTTIQTTTRAQTAVSIVTEFFDVYRARDVVAMTELCTDNCDFDYIPFEVWAKQRVVRGAGKVRTNGRVIWSGLINAFPNLGNDVFHIDGNDDGDVVVACDITGTQQSAWGFISPKNQYFAEPHLFIMHVNEDGLIDSIRAYWDNAGVNRQLGHFEVD
ncbi:nuclear transport factor 2 family protein [Rudaeicoccus suwonensis]|uniref:Ketosteroid isomerase-like protein n=1 Tax=Rudaeicoccus suwonensis TaxID=657409 RepID=A0A561E2Y8_9MICO|nr:ester cyclase [Rudaeicoccus suwonensis]TWE09978.1 ketosteroid isomerase-like protein [Rudaeicoccus suwonensis]